MMFRNFLLILLLKCVLCNNPILQSNPRSYLGPGIQNSYSVKEQLIEALKAHGLPHETRQQTTDTKAYLPNKIPMINIPDYYSDSSNSGMYDFDRKKVPGQPKLDLRFNFTSNPSVSEFSNHRIYVTSPISGLLYSSANVSSHDLKRIPGYNSSSSPGSQFFAPLNIIESSKAVYVTPSPPQHLNSGGPSYAKPNYANYLQRDHKPLYYTHNFQPEHLNRINSGVLHYIDEEKVSKREGLPSKSNLDSWESVNSWFNEYQSKSQDSKITNNNEVKAKPLSEKRVEDYDEEEEDDIDNDLEEQLAEELTELDYVYETRALTLGFILEIPTFILVPFFVLRPLMRQRRNIDVENSISEIRDSYDEPFYEDNLNKIDEFMDLLGVSSEFCKMRAICELSQHPSKYRPISHLVLKQLRPKSPVKTEQENRYYRYLTSSQLGYSGNSTACILKYPCPFETFDLFSPTGLELYDIVSDTFSVAVA